MQPIVYNTQSVDKGLYYTKPARCKLIEGLPKLHENMNICILFENARA